MTPEEKKRLEALVKSQFSDDNVVIPSFTASQIAFIERLIRLELKRSFNHFMNEALRERGYE